MISTLRLIAAFALVAVFTPSIAWAADYEPPIIPDQAPEFVPVEVGSGWYLRGDIGYSFNNTPWEDFDLFGISVDSTRFGAGGGFGYHFSDMVRGDLTLNFLSSDRFGIATPEINASWENQVWSGMASLYLDLGTYSGLTPYVGVGLGSVYSRNTVDILSGGFAAGAVDNQAELAYSLSVGASYKVGTNSSVDIGYQYVSSPDTQFLNTSTLALEDGLDYHQIKVGFRYDLW